MKPLALSIGKTYYRITYADAGMTMLGVEPLVYIGEATGEKGEPFHAFQDTVSYVRFGSRMAPGAIDHEDVLVYFIPPGETDVDVVDLAKVAEEAQACLERAASSGWPVLPVLRDGWFAAT